MHFELLVEGQTDNIFLSILMERIVGPYRNPHTWRIHPHRGIDILLQNLPAKLRAYGKEMQPDLVVVVLVDLDNKECCQLKQQLLAHLSHCTPPPQTLFRIAIEELEAWYFGDRQAILTAYPQAQTAILDDYQQDAPCGTWEKLAQATHPQQLVNLMINEKRNPINLDTKKEWAKKIPPHMDVEGNQSPSFQCFRDGLRRWCSLTKPI